jgi:glycerol uptake facilitator-like aquaporin
LVVLITILGPVSGAHLNPAVTLAFLLRRSITTGVAAAYLACQIAGGGVLGGVLSYTIHPSLRALSLAAFHSLPEFCRTYDF